MTKYDKNYYYDAIQFESLYKAMKRCCRNLRWKSSVSIYEYHGLRNTHKLRRSLYQNTYKILPYQHFKIYEPKERDIVATRFRDRQFQMSLCSNGLYSDIVEHFIKDNPACQTNKGTDYTFNRLTAQLRKYYLHYGNNGWVLKIDIKKFFPSTKHSIAKNEVSKYISDEIAYEHVCNIIDSFDSGIGLGSQVSQLIELSVLNELDHFIKEKLRPDVYIRYMDDMVLVFHNKEELEYMLSEITKFVHNLGFELNSKTQIYNLRQGIKIMNWTYYISNSGKIIRKMSKKKYGKQRRKLRKLWYKEINGLIEPGTTEESLRSFLANADRGNTFNQRRRIILFYKNLTGKEFHMKKVS